MEVSRVYPVLGVWEGDELVAAADLEVEDAVLYVAGQEHLALLAGQQQNTFNTSQVRGGVISFSWRPDFKWYPF